MGLLYIAEHGATLGISGGEIVVTYQDGRKDRMPKETITAISIFGRSQLTAPLVQYCLDKGIRVGYFSGTGRFYGTLVPTEYSDVIRLKKQIALTENKEWCLCLSKKLLVAKIVYFEALAGSVEERFYFRGRSKRPAKDPFNAMLNMGYSMLSQEIKGELENHGLCAYAGFLHQDRAQHAALVSDMIEEWRAVIVDSTVLSLIQGHEIGTEHFYFEEENCLFTKEGLRIFIAKLERKMFTQTKYLEYIDKPMDFRKAIWHQCECMARLVETGNMDCYQPVVIR